MSVDFQLGVDQRFALFWAESKLAMEGACPERVHSQAIIEEHYVWRPAFVTESMEFTIVCCICIIGIRETAPGYDARSRLQRARKGSSPSLL